ncbi:MAG: glycosyl transferase, partial [Deltaproteobacteria bacterium]|nr:glycosyl transferase [Deltaproteobacteria bacterium]
MRVAIVAPSPIPFVVGGAEKLWWGMQRHINENTTHSCELLKVPVKEHTVVDLLQAYYQFFTLDLSSYDRVISTKYPAFMVQHPDHHLYLQHLLRGCYDTYSAQLSTMPPWANQNLQRLLRTISRHDIDLTDIFNELFSFIQQHPDDRQFNQFPGPMIRSILHTLDRRGMEGVKQFSAISHTVKKRVEYFPPAAQVTVIHHPSNLTVFDNNGQNYL